MSWRTVLVRAALAVALVGCAGTPRDAANSTPTKSADPTATRSTPGDTTPSEPGEATTTEPTARGVVTLGFAGDVHFEAHLQPLLANPGRAFGPIEAALRKPDLMILNLETAITLRGAPEPKEYQFRTSPAALDALDAAGIDLASMANNHAVDYGPVGLRDTLAALRDSPVPVIGVGEDVDAAFQPHEVTIRGTKVAVFAATTKADHTAKEWAAGVDRAGVAVSLNPEPRLLKAVRQASDRVDVVVVYLHWGDEKDPCPTPSQLRHSRALSAAGADVVLGTHAHIPLGAGWLGDTYVNYGLGNFLWYNQFETDSGILKVTIRNGEVVRDAWAPAYIQADGRPQLLTGAQRAAEVAEWRRLRGCTGLAARPAD